MDALSLRSLKRHRCFASQIPVWIFRERGERERDAGVHERIRSGEERYQVGSQNIK